MTFEWFSLRSISSKGKSSSDSKNYLLFPNSPKNFYNYKNTFKTLNKNKMNYQPNFKTHPIKTDGENSVDRILMKKRSMLKSVFLNKDWTVRKNNCWRNNWFWMKLQIYRKNWKKMPLTEDNLLWKCLRKLINSKADSETWLVKWRPLSQNSLCVKPIS